MAPLMAAERQKRIELLTKMADSRDMARKIFRRV